MANVDKAYGLVPVKGYGSAWNGETMECVALSSYATALYVGDPVVIAGSGDAEGRPSIERAVGTEGVVSTAIYGVIVGFEPTSRSSLDSSKAGAASTTRIVQVAPAFPSVFFKVNPNAGVQPDDIGSHFDLVDGGEEDVALGRSGFELAAASAGTTALQVKLVRFVRRADNEIVSGEDTAGIDCIVTFQESSWFGQGTGV